MDRKGTESITALHTTLASMSPRISVIVAIRLFESNNGWHDHCLKVNLSFPPEHGLLRLVCCKFWLVFRVYYCRCLINLSAKSPDDKQFTMAWCTLVVHRPEGMIYYSFHWERPSVCSWTLFLFEFQLLVLSRVKQISKNERFWFAKTLSETHALRELAPEEHTL